MNTKPCCTLLSSFTALDCLRMKIMYEINPKQFKELTTLIANILNDNSKKLALLNLKHDHPCIQFIAKYKLNLNCKDLTFIGPF